MAKSKKISYGHNGFTLFEIAVVTTIAGIILLSIFKALMLYTEERARMTTNENISFVEASFSRFYQEQGRYPCPAPLDAVPGDPDYGIEQCDPEDLDVVPYIDHPIDNGDTSTPDVETIMVGAVPILTIEPCLRPGNAACTSGTDDFYLTEDMIYDGWGNRITYVVTEDLTDATSFSISGGAIDIQDENEQSILENEYSAHFVLISHGPNGRGAFNRNGQFVAEDCRLAAGSETPGDASDDVPFSDIAGVHSERENCDHDEGVYVSGLLNKTDPNDRYYDDIITFRLIELSSLWERMGLSEMINKNEGNVGIGDYKPGNEPPDKLSILGDMQSVDLYADSLCDVDGVNCMPPALLGGDAVTDAAANGYSNTCSNPGEAIVELSNNLVRCAPVYTGAILAGQCAKDNPATTSVNEYEVMVGYSNQTGIICQRLYP